MAIIPRRIWQTAKHSLSFLLSVARKSAFFALFAAILLALNLGMIFSARVADAVLGALRLMGATPTLVSATAAGELKRELSDERKKSIKLGKDLDAEKRKVTLLETKSQNLAADLDAEKQKVTRLKSGAKKNRGTVLQKTDLIADRTRRVAVVNVASIPLESVPVVGAAVVLGITAWEIRQACEVMEEMKELRIALDIPTDTAWSTSVCDIVVNFTPVNEMTLADCYSHARKVGQKLGPEHQESVLRICKDIAMPPHPTRSSDPSPTGKITLPQRP